MCYLFLFSNSLTLDTNLLETSSMLSFVLDFCVFSLINCKQKQKIYMRLMKIIHQVLVLVIALSLYVDIYQENTKSQNMGKTLWHQKMKNDYL